MESLLSPNQTWENFEGYIVVVLGNYLLRISQYIYKSEEKPPIESTGNDNQSSSADEYIQHANPVPEVIIVIEPAPNPQNPNEIYGT